MQNAPDLPSGFMKVGDYDFVKGESVKVTITTEDSGGFVHVDALQVLSTK